MRDSSELKLFYQTVYDFARQEIYPHRRAWEEAGATPRELYRDMAALGFFGIRYPEELGGMGGNFYHTEAFCDALISGSTLLGPAINVQVHMDMATPIINLLGTPEQKQEFLIPAIRGETIWGLGITEPGGGSDVAALRTTARADGGDYVINGAKTFITNGSIADYITLAVRTGPAGHRGISLVAFPTKSKGFSVGRKLHKMGCHSSDTAELHFDGCRIPRRNLIGEENQGFYTIMKNFQIERLIIAIDAIAIARVMYDEALRYLKERQAFGKNLLDHQVLCHEMVELATEIECAHLLNQKATDLVVAQPTESPTRHITMAKFKSTELVNRVATQCLQMFGGYGYMEEYELPRLFRDTRVLNIVGGTSHIMKEILGKMM
jgi:citronellyl-CoA dehydrogenase